MEAVAAGPHHIQGPAQHSRKALAVDLLHREGRGFSSASRSRTHSCEKFVHQQLSHTGSDGFNPFQRMAASGFTPSPYAQEGENIGQAGSVTPSNTVALIDNETMAEPLNYGNRYGLRALTNLNLAAADVNSILTHTSTRS